MKVYAEIIVPRPLPGALTYSIPAELVDQISFGSLVEVPFRKQKSFGFVIKKTSTLSQEISDDVVKPISTVMFSEPVFNEKDFEFFQWISEYYQLPLGDVFKSAFPKPALTPLKRASKKSELTSPSLLASPAQIILTDEQRSALNKISQSIANESYESFLLHGITGSGKTEVYMHAAEQALQLGKSTLILVPEIALTPQLRDRFESRFQDRVAILHSGLSDKERREYWWSIRRNEKKIVLGARSALFAPLTNIGLIVVDEEHESTYKQEDHLRYNARDLALVRAKQHQAIAILGSATPSIETYYAATQRKHTLIELTRRPGISVLPHVECIDLKSEPLEDPLNQKKRGGTGLHVFSAKMRNALLEVFEKKEQAMLLINRKGYSSFILCTQCGYVPECPNCSVTLTYYQKKDLLRCHYCSYEVKSESQCKQCSSENLQFMGLGSELVETELRKILPEASIARLDTDIISNPKILEQTLEDFRNQKTQFLVGTQMIAKGHDFPNVTFIGVILADLNIHLPEFRATEKSFQLLAQVSGRAGRAQKPGRVFVQTYIPEHYVLQHALQHNYKGFYAKEIDTRKDFCYPPFFKIAQIEFRHLKESEARSQAKESEKILASLRKDHQLHFEYLGPAPATISRIANQFRWHILLKAEKYSTLNRVIKTLRKNGVRFIDVDPMNTL